jgi:RNA polymerase sigma-70 factor (ECF subfamily)
MLAFKAGSEEAFRQLIGRNQAKVYSMLCRLVNDQTQAEDLAQEVFLRVFRTAKRYEPMAKFSTWIYRIAVNVALNSIRSAKKLRFAPLDVGDGDEDSTWHRDVPDMRLAPPHSQLATAELSAKLAEAVAALPENQRIAVTLNRYENMSYQEIAGVLGCSTMAVKSLLSRARGSLKDSLVRYMGKEFMKNFPNP